MKAAEAKKLTEQARVDKMTVGVDEKIYEAIAAAAKEGHDSIEVKDLTKEAESILLNEGYLVFEWKDRGNKMISW